MLGMRIPVFKKVARINFLRDVSCFRGWLVQRRAAMRISRMHGDGDETVAEFHFARCSGLTGMDFFYFGSLAEDYGGR